MHDIHSLAERAKELRCLYAIESVVCDRDLKPTQAFIRILQEIPSGWQDPESTGARIEYLGRSFVGPQFSFDGQLLTESITLWKREIGSISVSRRSPAPSVTGNAFLPEEEELLRRIAARIGEFLEWKHMDLLGERTPSSATHWAWRQRFAEALADSIDAERFGVTRLYLGGSTARGDAGPASDIDIYIRCDGTEQQHAELAMWIDGWSHCLAEVALQQTGQPFPGGIFNVQWLVGDPGVWQLAELQELKLRTKQSAKL
ncbi:MAG: nucleotidyltransferase family protein [Phycisphaerales bacterium JB065]